MFDRHLRGAARRALGAALTIRATQSSSLASARWNDLAEASATRSLNVRNLAEKKADALPGKLDGHAQSQKCDAPVYAERMAC